MCSGVSFSGILLNFAGGSLYSFIKYREAQTAKRYKKINSVANIGSTDEDRDVAMKHMTNGHVVVNLPQSGNS